MGAPVHPPVSVVVASNRSPELLFACVQSLLPECRELEAELVVARDGTDAAAEHLRHEFPEVRLVTVAAGASIPRLRGEGMSAAGGKRVALTEDHCIARPGWLRALVSGLEQGADVVGGGMGNARRSRAVDWAAYFSEYGFFSSTRPGEGPDTPLLTGANVAYGSKVVDEVTRWALEGEWENTIHRRLDAGARSFGFIPEARILQNQTYEFGSFCRDRFEHGLDYARTRLTEEPGTSRWLRFLSTPLLPLLLLCQKLKRPLLQAPGALEGGVGGSEVPWLSHMWPLGHRSLVCFL